MSALPARNTCFYHFKKWYDCTPSKYRELTAPLHSRLPHNYYSCDQLKAEKLLNSFRYESSHSGRDIKRGSPISGLLEKDRLPEKSDAARLKHFIKLLVFIRGDLPICNRNRRKSIRPSRICRSSGKRTERPPFRHAEQLRSFPCRNHALPENFFSERDLR